MGRSIRDYVSEGADVTYGQLAKRFGEPKQIGFIYVNEMETDELISEMNIRKRTVRIIAAAAFIMVVMWAAIVGICYFEHTKDINGYAVVEVFVVERKLINEGE